MGDLEIDYFQFIIKNIEDLKEKYASCR